MPNSPAELSIAIKAKADSLGFALCGVCPASEPVGLARFHEWLEEGYAGQMKYLSDRATAYEHPRFVLDGAKSLVLLAINYRTEEPQPTGENEGRVSRYAWGEQDYHDLIREKLHALADYVRQQAPSANTRGVVDTAPLLERDFAQMAGLGWIGKNTLLINRQKGSLFFLAALLTDLELEYDSPHETDHCGTCRACLDACPTDAFPQPYVLDATRCISYLTIELREAIPDSLRELMGDWIFGCDICQDVCPWNRRAPVSEEPSFAPVEGMNPVELCHLFEMDDESFRRRFRRTPLWRSKRKGILRNAAIAIGNRPTQKGLSALVLGLNDLEPLVREAAAWALGRFAQAEAFAALNARLELEEYEPVREEIKRALAERDK